MSRPRLPFEFLVALRFLREGRMQTALILLGVTGGVAVIVFLSQLIAQLQSTIIDRVLGSQAHVVVRPLEEVNLRARPDLTGTTIIEPRAQRLRSIDQWESIMELAEAQPRVVAVSPVVSGPAFALRGRASKSVALVGVDPDRYRRIVKMDTYMTRGKFQVEGTNTIIGIELAKDLGVTVGDKVFLRAAGGRDELLQVTGLFDIGNKDLNRRWVFTTMKLAQSLLDLPGGVSNIDITVADIFDASEVAARIAGRQRHDGRKLDDDQFAIAGGAAQPVGVEQPDPQLRGHHRCARHIERAGGERGAEAEGDRHPARHGHQLEPHHGCLLLQGALVGFVGALSGVGLAWALLQIFSTIYRTGDGAPIFEPQLDTGIALSAAGIALVVGVLAALIPARRAAKMDPVQAIRS
jgi:lipoprotein-releasing system permease protein